MNLTQVFISIFIAGAVTFFTRAVPFIFFRKRTPPPMVVYLQKHIPPMTMVILVAYCLKDVAWGNFPHGIPAIAGVIVTAALHIWRGNALLSIFSGTALYMFLMRSM